MEANEFLTMRNISKDFPGVRALSDVTFRLRAGTIHGLVGENGAGKSTLMKILTGMYNEFRGEIFLDGKKIYFERERDAIDAGICIVAQELNPIQELDVAQNIFIGKEPVGKFPGWIDRKTLYKEAGSLLKSLCLDYSVTEKLKNMSVAQRQMVEIAKAISCGGRIIVMDEPTSALTHVEAENLFRQMERLRGIGVSIIFITHKIDEIFRVCDEISVMRDGRMIGSQLAADLSEGEVIRMMVGRELTNLYPPRGADKSGGEAVLEVKNLTRGGVFQDVSFTVKRGEIVGIAGMMGAGRSEVMRCVFGLDRPDGGEIFIDGRSAEIKSTHDAINSGIAMITEDRATYGFVGVMSIADNILLPNTDKLAPNLFIKRREAKKVSEEISEKINIKAHSVNTNVLTLSGGNQQKVVLAKWLVRDIKVLIMDEPTRGIDVGAKYEIYKLMISLAKQGISIIMISSEMPEVIGMSNRVLVMSGGKIRAELPGGHVTQEEIMRIILQGR
jgi:ABC-type sugar transport system ATPase subunit